MSSYVLAENYSLQSISWAICGSLIAVIRFLLALVGQLFGVVSHLAQYWPYALLGAGLIWLLCNPAILACLALIALFGWATYPRTAVRK